MSDNKTEQKPVIRIENLHKYFGDNQVLRGIDLEVMPGEKVVVLGPSGSGKSTMLRCINALEETTSGKIYVNDVDITSPKTDINKVREHLGMVFQRFNLWPHKTVLENVALAPKLVSGVNKAEAEKKAMEMLKRVGLAEKPTLIPQAFPAVSSSVLRLLEAWQWGRRLCCLTNRHLRLTRNSWAKC